VPYVRRLRSSFALALLLTTASGGAQDAEETPVIVPPALETYAEAEVPPDALEVGQTLEVTLAVTIDAEGAVTQATVVEGAGEPFDAAAVEAGRRLRFRPATRDGAPIPARIRFRYTFEGPQPVEEPEAPAEPDPGRLEGRILTSEEEALAGARVLLDSTDGAVALEAMADPEGRFEIAEVPPGDYVVTVLAEDQETYDGTETVVSGEALEVTYRLSPSSPEPAVAEDGVAEFRAQAVGEPPPRQATRRRLEREILTTTPGTRGDALRVIELLPGVARPPFLAGLIIIRGAAPGDSEVFVDGSSVPLLYHFGGLTSFYNSRLLDTIDFYPGNFSVRYGRRIGGIIEVTPRDPNIDAPHGVIDINLIDASLIIETPIGNNMAIALAARRSYVDFFFENVVPDDLFSVVAAPVYYDYQLTWSWRPNDSDRVRLLVYGSSDAFNTIFGGDEQDQDFSIDLRTQFHRAQLSWRHLFGDDVQMDAMLSGGVTDLVINAGAAFNFDADFIPFTFRNEWQWRVAEGVSLTAGMDINWAPVTLDIAASTPQQGEGQPDAPDPNPTPTEAFFDEESYRPAAYLEANLQPLEELQIVAGVRLDYFRDIGRTTVDPRATFRLSLTDQWILKGGLGLFSQPPEFAESAPGLGNPNLEPIRAIHSSLGAEFRPDRYWRFEAEGYYKQIFDRPVGTEGGQPPFFESEGIGRIYGLEVGARLQPSRDFPVTGILSYTLSRSERLDGDDEEWRLFDFDQTHIFTLALNWQPGDGWTLGGAFRLVSGNPLTPVNGSVLDPSTGVYQPLFGATNSARNPLFNRLDLRIEKVFEIGDLVRLAIFLDVQNVYNATNQEAVTYSFDFSEQAVIPGLPVLPSLGIRGEI
jgi:TonB family protein